MFKNIYLACLLLLSILFIPIQAKTNPLSDQKLYLFSKSTCPYCIKVLNYLTIRKKIIQIKDIGKEPAALQELIAKGGKKQVPCLYHNGVYLYESNDIITWLENHLDLLIDAS